MKDNVNLNDLFDNFISMAESVNDYKGLWREKPVGLVEFFIDYLGETPYEGKQTELLETVDRILSKDDLPEDDKLRSVTEVATMFGKGCKHGSSTIVDAETGKTYTMKELADQQKMIKVTSYDYTEQKLVIGQASPPSLIGRTEMYKVTTASGHETIVTKEHVFLNRAYKGKNKKGKERGLKWKRLEDLNVGDSIALASNYIYKNGLELDKNEMRLCGYWIGDGSFTSPNGDGNFLASNEEVKENYCNILRSYGIEPKFPYYANEARTDRNCYMIKHSLTPWESRLGNNAINNIAKKYGFTDVNCYNKRIPKIIFDADEKSIIEFLRALFATDGWVCLMNSRIPQIGYCSVNKDLILDLQKLLLKIGIVARFDEKKTKSNFGKAYQLHISSKEYFIKFCEKVNIIGKTQKQEEILKLISDFKSIRKAEDIYWVKIKSIESIGEDDYYDLTVMNYGNYVSDGFIDHNSGKDFLISGIAAYVPYRLNCMYNPQEYFSFGKGEPIDIINLAKNAKQAENVFFSKLKARLENCSWFSKVDRKPLVYNEYWEKKDTIIFYNNVRCFSGHSEAGSFEGFNPLVGIFDEIGDFEMNLAEFCYDTIRSSAISRFGKRALLLFISFPRSIGDMIFRKYNEGQNDEYPEVISFKGTSWEVNPKIKREDLQMDYDKDPESAQLRFECIPPLLRGGFFQYPERIQDCIKLAKTNACTIEEDVITRELEDGSQRHFVAINTRLLEDTLELDSSKIYYMGLDGGITTDSYVLSLFYADTYFEEVFQGGEAVEIPRNKPIEVLLIEWKPDKRNKTPVSVQNVIDTVEIICNKVFVKKALMDKFNSGAMVQKMLELGVEADDKVFSNPFQLQIYTNFKNLAYTGNLELLDLETHNDDLKHILLVNGNKIDHERNRSKDSADARVAAVWLCASDEAETISNFSMPSIEGAKRY